MPTRPSSASLWSRERPELEFGPGTFGENLTTEGLWTAT
jgi:MOSC domain-containing protein YiiM